MSDRRDKSGPFPREPFVQGDTDRVRRQMEELQARQLAVVQKELAELESYTPPPSALPDEIKAHWQHQNERILAMHQQIVQSANSAIIRELEALRNQNARHEWKIGIMWKVMVFIAILAAGGIGAAFSAVRNSGEVEGDIKAEMLSNRRDIDRHEQSIEFLLTARRIAMPLGPNP